MLQIIVDDSHCLFFFDAEDAEHAEMRCRGAAGLRPMRRPHGGHKPALTLGRLVSPPRDPRIRPRKRGPAAARVEKCLDAMRNVPGEIPESSFAESGAQRDLLDES